MVNIEFFEGLDPDQAETRYPVSQKMIQFMGGVQGEELNWQEEWHLHLEQKYTGTIGLTDHNQACSDQASPCLVSISDSDNNSK